MRNPLPPYEYVALRRAETDARDMRRNTRSHGSIHPKVKSARLCGWLDKAVNNGEFIIVQSIKGKKYRTKY